MGGSFIERVAQNKCQSRIRLNFCINDLSLARYDIRRCRMIYLLRKYDIISVPSYAEGIYHRSKSDIISKIYHPFQLERISLKNDKFLSKLVVFLGGVRGI